MRILICDDDECERLRTYMLVSEYLKEKNLKAEIVQFQNAVTLLEYEKNVGSSEIYILDIIMPNTDGIALGKTLYERHDSSFILYLTSSREFAIDAFSVKAFSYLVKPVEKNAIFYELSLCFQKLIQAEKKVKIKTKDNIQNLKISEIVAVEYYGHQLIYHTMEGKIEGICQRKSFDESIYDFIQGGNFIKVSASFILNARHIKNATNESFFMDNGTSYKITRRYASAKKEYMDFILKSGGGGEV